MKLNNVFENLYTLYRENKLAHAYLLETNDIIYISKYLCYCKS